MIKSILNLRVNGVTATMINRRQALNGIRVKTILIFFGILIFSSCVGSSGNVVSVKTVEQKPLSGLADETLSQLQEIQKNRQQNTEDTGLKKMIRHTPNYSVAEYLRTHPGANNPQARNYTIGGYDELDIVVYEEEDLSRKAVPVSAEGYITFPLIGRINLNGTTTSQAEEMISGKLAEQQYLLNAHVSVTVKEYKSKQYIVLGSVEEPGSYPLKAQERVLDAISQAGGIDFEMGGKQGMLIRSLTPGSDREEKIVIRIDLNELLKGGDQSANLLLSDNDLLYIPKAENYYIIGQVQKPGSYPYLEKEISLVEAISQAGGFTPIAARNKTRIVRVENGVEKIIEVQVDAITDSGKKAQDVVVMPGDVIVVPESFF